MFSPDPQLSDADFLRALMPPDYGIPEIHETNARIERIAASLEARRAESVEQASRKDRPPFREIEEDAEGWWFWNESWTDRAGPYVSFEDCRLALKIYCVSVLGDGAAPGPFPAPRESRSAESSERSAERFPPRDATREEIAAFAAAHPSERPFIGSDVWRRMCASWEEKSEPRAQSKEIVAAALKYCSAFKVYHSAEHATTEQADVLIAARNVLLEAVERSAEK